MTPEPRCASFWRMSGRRARDECGHWERRSATLIGNGLHARPHTSREPSRASTIDSHLDARAATTRKGPGCPGAAAGGEDETCSDS